jgi:hypothetical protein
MKSPLIAALFLSGCAAQPMVSAPVSYQPSAADSRQVCIEHISRTIAFAEVTEPVLDKCLAGNRQQCVVFAMVLDRQQPQESGKVAAKCFESGDTFGGLAYRVNAVLPRINKKLGRYNKLMGAS